MSDSEGDLVNGRPIATPELVSSWFKSGKLRVPPGQAMIPLVQDLNYLALLWFCWDPTTASIRRLGPTWAPPKKLTRGRPMSLENNVADNIRDRVFQIDPKAHTDGAHYVVAEALKWLGVPKAEDTFGRSSRRRRAMRT